MQTVTRIHQFLTSYPSLISVALKPPLLVVLSLKVPMYYLSAYMLITTKFEIVYKSVTRSL